MNLTKHQERLHWLQKNHKLWTNYNPDTPSWLEIEQDLLVRMKKAGLYESSITLLDVSLEHLIFKVRRMQIGAAKGAAKSRKRK